MTETRSCHTVWVHSPNLSLSTDALISVHIKKEANNLARIIITTAAYSDIPQFRQTPIPTPFGAAIPTPFGAAIPTPFRTTIPTVYLRGSLIWGIVSLFVECLSPVWWGLNGFFSGFCNLNNILASVTHTKSRHRNYYPSSSSQLTNIYSALWHWTQSWWKPF